MTSQMGTLLSSGFLDAKAAERYKSAENATRPYAKIIVQKSGIAQYVESGGEAHVLDFACGTGAVVQEVYNSVPKEKWGQLKVTGTDMSPVMLEYLGKRGEREGWVGLERKIVDGNDDITKSLPESTYTHIFVSFAVIVLPSHMLQRLQSLLRPNGFIAVTSWVNVPWFPLVARSISRMSPPQPYSPTTDEVQNSICGNWASSSYMDKQLQEAGLKDTGVMTEKKKALVGSPNVFADAMQFPLGVIAKMWWEEDGRVERLKELSSVMEKVLVEDVVEGGEVELEFEGVVGWGWKSG